jgi:ribose transport system permease protein
MVLTGRRNGTMNDDAIPVEIDRVDRPALKGGIAARVRLPRERRGVWILNAALLVVLAFEAPTFYTAGNIETVLGDTAILGIVAAGMTVLIMAGAFDLSVTSIMGLAPIVAVSVAGDRSGLSLLLLSVLTGVGLGAVNGLIITRGRVAPFVATLGTLFVFGSLADIISKGNALVVTNPTVLKLGTGSIGQLVPYSFLIMIAVFGMCHVLLRRLHLGRWVRAAGSNLRAAHVGGIDVRWVFFALFVISGALTGLAGILLSGYLASADATQAPNYNLNAIAVVVVGGTSLRGGEGTLVGTALAAWLFAVVGNGLVLLGVNSYWQYVATGIIVVLALILGKVGFGGEIWPRRRGISGGAPPQSLDVAPTAAAAVDSAPSDV